MSAFQLYLFISSLYFVYLRQSIALFNNQGRYVAPLEDFTNAAFIFVHLPTTRLLNLLVTLPAQWQTVCRKWTQPFAHSHLHYVQFSLCQTAMSYATQMQALIALTHRAAIATQTYYGLSTGTRSITCWRSLQLLTETECSQMVQIHIRVMTHDATDTFAKHQCSQWCEHRHCSCLYIT